MKSIRETGQKFKDFLRSFENSDLALLLVIVLVAFASFGLGRLSHENNSSFGIQVGERELPTVPASVYSVLQKRGVSQEDVDVILVASRNSDKYHYTWCSGAERITEENKIYFLSIEEAREAGYTAAQNCKGLK